MGETYSHQYNQAQVCKKFSARQTFNLKKEFSMLLYSHQILAIYIHSIVEYCVSTRGGLTIHCSNSIGGRLPY